MKLVSEKISGANFWSNDFEWKIPIENVPRPKPFRAQPQVSKFHVGTIFVSETKLVSEKIRGAIFRPNEFELEILMENALRPADQIP